MICGFRTVICGDRGGFGVVLDFGLGGSVKLDEKRRGGWWRIELRIFIKIN